MGQQFTCDVVQLFGIERRCRTGRLQFIEQLRIKRPDCPSIIAITGAPTSALPDGVIEGPYRGFVSAIFRKPFDHAKLRETIAFCVTA